MLILMKFDGKFPCCCFVVMAGWPDGMVAGQLKLRTCTKLVMIHILSYRTASNINHNHIFIFVNTLLILIQ